MMQMMATDSGTENVDWETKSSESFQEYFTRRFSNKGVNFQKCYLEEAMNEGKVVVLFLHFKNSNFLTTFNRHLMDSEVKELIKSSCVLLGRDMGLHQYRNAVTESLDSEELSDKSYRWYISMHTSVAIIIVPGKNALYVDNIYGHCFSSMLEEKIEENYKEMTRKKLTSIDFQNQMMCNFGTSDYDNFDYYELEFLKKKIGFALFGAPRRIAGYDEEAENKIEQLYNVILQESNSFNKHKDRVLISFIFNSTEPLDELKEKRKLANKYYDPTKDTVPRPIFVLRKCKSEPAYNSRIPCRVFIDELGRVYKTWAEYLNENRLEECKMILPKDGRYRERNGKIILEEHLSPACRLSNKVMHKADIAGSVVGTAAGLVGIIGTSITVAPAVLATAGVAGITAGILALGRSASSLRDRNKHKEDLSLRNPGARGDYLNLAAGSLSFVGTGANAVLSKLVNRGVRVGMGTKIAINTINMTNIAVSGIGIANSTYIIVDQWWNKDQKPSRLAITQLAFSVLFFSHAVCNFRTVGTLVEESQARNLNTFQARLRRYGSDFKRVMKNTVYQVNDQIQKGHTEVIRVLRNVDSVEQVFSTLTSNSRTICEQGFRFFVQNGRLILNGKMVNMANFAQINSNRLNQLWSNLPSVPEPTPSYISRVSSHLQKMFTDVHFDTKLVGELANSIGNPQESVMQLISNGVFQLIQKIAANDRAFLDMVTLSNRQKFYLQLIQMTANWLNDKTNEMEEKYQKWLKTKDPELEEPYFVFLSSDDVKRMNEIFPYVSKALTVASKLNRDGLRELIDYYIAWTANEIFSNITYEERKEKRRNHSNMFKYQMHCNDCGGFYYSAPKLNKNSFN